MVTQYDDEQEPQTAESAEQPPPAPEAGSGLTVDAAGGEQNTDVAAERERILAEMKRLSAQLQATSPSSAGEAAVYEVKTWNGYPLYCCRFCEWTTFDEALAEDHFSDGRYFAIHRNNPAFTSAWGDTPPPPVPDE